MLRPPEATEAGLGRPPTPFRDSTTSGSSERSDDVVVNALSLRSSSNAVVVEASIVWIKSLVVLLPGAHKGHKACNVVVFQGLEFGADLPEGSGSLSGSGGLWAFVIGTANERKVPRGRC